MEMDSEHWQGGREVARRRVEKGKQRTRWRSTETLQKLVPPTPRPSCRGWRRGSRFPPGSSSGVPRSHSSPETGAVRSSLDPLLPCIHPPTTPCPINRVQAVADWLRGAASQLPVSEAGAEQVRGGRRTNRLWEPLPSPCAQRPVPCALSEGRARTPGRQVRREQRGPRPRVEASPAGREALLLQLLPPQPPPPSRHPERAGRPGAETRGARGELMEHTHAHLVANSSLSWSPGSVCGLGFVPVVYYSLLLCLGLPGEEHAGEGGSQEPQVRSNPAQNPQASISSPCDPWRSL